MTRFTFRSASKSRTSLMTTLSRQKLLKRTSRKSTLFKSTLFKSTLLKSTLLKSTVLKSTVLKSTVLKSTLLLIVFTAGHAAAAPSSTTAPPAVDKETAAAVDEALTLATHLIQNGDHDRAETVLAAIDDDLAGLERGRLFRLRGHVALVRGDARAALEFLSRAIDAGIDTPAVFVDAARAAAAVGEHARAVHFLDGAGAAGRASPSLFLLRARAHLAMDDLALALLSSFEGQKKFPDAHALTVFTARALVDARLIQDAFDVVTPHLDAMDLDHARHVAAMFRASSTGDLGLIVVEMAHARFPLDRSVSQSAAQAYAVRDRPRSGALVLEGAARLDRSLSVDVAELYRRAGDGEIALFWNASAPDDARKVRQRFSILIDGARFEEAVALSPRLHRWRLLDDGDVAYAYAFALHMSDRRPRALEVLAAIDDPANFHHATTLRHFITACLDDARRCP